MSPFRGLFSLLLMLVICFRVRAQGCYRKPQGATGDPSAVDENYQILISGNPTTYHPGQQYNITLACDPKLKFITFTVVVEAEDPGIIADHELLGTFYILDKAETKFSDLCTNMVESNNNNIKESVSLAWVAPSNPKSGCVLFKAAVLQQRDVWFIDGGFLTKRLCPEEIDEVNSLTPPVRTCCACDEAKYEVVIERKWTRNSHPNDFPLEAWRTRFGKVIGTSHSVDYTFWEYGTKASRGLQQLAEHGATEALENEIKRDSSVNDGIRTIIKAPGVDFKSNVVTRTLANVRVSPRHHQISLVTKIDPSPDWILGVASLELCLSNCTWVDKKVLNLYPWDVGTDAGPSYMSADQAQKPPDVIRRISSSFPNDVRSPFYDEAGSPMNPMATLKLTRKRTYERPCIDVDIVGYIECAVHPWKDWSECSAKCGAGKQFRERSFKNEEVARNFPNCTDVRLKQIQNCEGTQCGLPLGSDARSSLAECELTPWSPWSQCSKKCGKGYQTRTREYVNALATDKCQNASPMDLVETVTCRGNFCGGNIGGASSYDSLDSGGAYANNYDGYSNANMYPGSSYSNQGSTGGRYGSTQRQEYNPYGSSNLNPYGSSDMGPKIPGANDYNAVSSSYGSDQLRGNIDGNQPLFGDLETSYDDSSPFGSAGGIGNYDSNQTPNPPPLNIYGNINTPYQNPNVQVDDNNSPYPNRYGDMGNANQYQGRNGGTLSDSLYQNQAGNMANAAGDLFSNQYTPSSDPLYNKNSYNDQRATTRRPYGQQSSYTTSRSNFYDSPSSAAFDNSMGFGNTDDPNASTDNVNYCQQKPIPYGPCNQKRIIIKNYWFYDADDGQCKLFTADNCDQNRNKFFSLESCERACAGQSLNFVSDSNMNQGYGNGYDQSSSYGNGGYDPTSSYGIQRPWTT